MLFPGTPFQMPAAAAATPVQGIRTAQIICAAMIVGVLTFLGVTLVVSAPPRPPVLAYVAVGIASIAIALRLIVPAVAVRGQLKALAKNEIENPGGALFAVFQIKLIIGLALLEGACFFGLVAYLAEHQWWSLAVVAFLLLLMASMFPTLRQFEAWADDVKRDRQNQF